MKPFSIFAAAALAVCLVVLSGFSPVHRSSDMMATVSGSIVDLDTVFIHLNNCNAAGELCLPLSLGQALKMRITDNGQPVNISIQNGCNFDTTSAYTYSTLFGMGNFGPYLLTSWPVGGQIFSDTFKNIPHLVQKMNQWDPNGNWMLDPAHLLITGGKPGQMYDTMKVMVLQIQTPSFIGYNFGVTPRGTGLSFKKGFHEVILEDTTNLSRDTFYVRVSCSSSEFRSIDKDSSQIFCPTFDDLLGAPQHISMCQTSSDVVDFQLNNNNCVVFTGKRVGTAETCVVACDAFGLCDTIFLKVNVAGSGTSFYRYVEIAKEQLVIIPLDTPSLGGAIADVKFCNTTFNGFADFVFNPQTMKIEARGIQRGGADTVCVVACDAAGVCDTTVLTVRVRRFGADWRHETLFLNQIGSTIVDIKNLPAPPKKLEIFRQPDPLMFFYNLNQNNFSVTYTALKPGIDTMGLRLRDERNNWDTTYLVLTVLKPQTEIIKYNLEASETKKYCFSTHELGGNAFSLTNICEKTSNRHVSFDFDDITLCLEMQALTPGTDTACVILCDNLGVCDTVIFYVTASDDIFQQPPVANPDNGLSQNFQPTKISVLDNDVLPSPLTNIFLLPPAGNFGPKNGTATLNKTTGIVEYTPKGDFCNTTDNFLYVVCTSGGCDTALVTVFIQCDDTGETDKLLVFNAFSPNGDDANPTFVIKNIEKYPGAEILVFNRWGNTVFQKIDYRNDWEGSWEGKMLPDGIYFYYLNDGKGNIQKGALTIKR